MNGNDPFRIEKDDHIAWLILNRPEKRNTMGFPFYESLIGQFAVFDADPDVRVVVIRAEGKSFTAGTDLEDLGSLYKQMTASEREDLRLKILQAQQGINSIEKCRKPVIAAVHGHCLGGGVDLLCACDIRIAAADAVFGIREVRVAFIADVGTLQRLPHIIGEGWFRELALTGRDFDAEEALKMRFITRICRDKDELIAEAKKIAQQIASCSPLAIQGTKEVILYSRDNGVYPGLEYVAQKNSALIPSEDMLEALAAFMEKRVPVFK
ncbi:MAG: crotonase/enoyl-CoA hydratase family protein [Syntrophales bacterium]|jgi:enoyl-CoA hydratase/carnithine racemase